MSIRNALEKADIFAKPRGFSIDGTEKYKTRLGVACTCFFMLTTLSAVVFFSIKFLNRKENPVVKSKFKYLERSPHLNLIGLNFVFSISGFVENKAIQPEQLLRTLDIKFAIGRRYVNSKNTIQEDLDYVKARPCKKEDFTIYGVNIVSASHLTEFTMSVCPDSSKLFIDGENLEKNSTFFKVIVKPCTVNCRPDAASIILYKDIRLKLGHSHASIREKSFKKPFKHYLVTNIEYPCYDTKSFHRKFFLRRIDVTTDIGLFKQEKETISSVNFDRYYVEDRFRGRGDPYVDIEFYSSHHIRVVQRSYDKIPDVLSDIGGILSLVLGIIGGTYKIYNKCKLKIHIVNKTFLYNKNNRNHDHEWKFFISDMPKIYCFKIMKLLGCKKYFSKKIQTKTDIFTNGLRRSHKYLDVNTVIQNSRDIEIFKKIFFSRYHHSCLDALELDSLLIDDTEYLDYKDEIDIETAYNNFFKKSHSNKNDPIDRKLNLFFDEHIESLMINHYGSKEKIPKRFEYDRYQNEKNTRARRKEVVLNRKRLKRVLNKFASGQKKPKFPDQLLKKKIIKKNKESKHEIKERLNDVGGILGQISKLGKKSKNPSMDFDINDALNKKNQFQRSKNRKTTIDCVLTSPIQKDEKEKKDRLRKNFARRLSQNVMKKEENKYFESFSFEG